LRLICDLQLHSYLSRATSKNMDLEHIAEGAKIKGLTLVGTGDCLHPKWLEELIKKLELVEETGIYKYRDMYWIITGEVSTVYEQDKKFRKVHHLFYLPNVEVAKQLSDELKKFGNLNSDGRPTLTNLTSPEFVEILIGISKDIIVLPSHAWTPWFSVFGSKSGFNSLEECYQDQNKNIFAFETGLSSDPAMNWRLSQLDNVTLMSNSDSHSPNPWRLGREANVFELKEISYKEIYDAIKNKDKNKFLFTIETDPNYGKYHFDGHKKCGVSFSPSEAKKLNNICPICKRKLIIGVLHRVDELADRPEGFVPKNAIPFKTLLPLYEIISFVAGTGELYSKKTILEQNKLIEKFGNELNVLLNADREELIKVTDEKIADAIIKVREGKIQYVAGYDGVYGVPVFSEEEFNKIKKRQEIKVLEQRTLSDFKGSVV